MFGERLVGLRQACGKWFTLSPHVIGGSGALFADNSAILFPFIDFPHHPPPILFYSLTSDEELKEV